MISGNDEWIIGISNVHHQDIWIVINEIVYVIGSQQERGYDLALVDSFHRAIDNSFFDKFQYAICEHFGMKAQILMMMKLSGKGIRQSSDSHLQAGPVIDQFCAILANKDLCRCRFCKCSCNQWSIVAYEIIDSV